MSGFDIRIHFHGLIGLVPVDDKRILLALPDLARGTEPETKPNKLPERIPPHVPCIVVPDNYLDSKDHAILDFERLGTGEGRRCLFLFDRERLTLSYGGASAGVSGFPSPLSDIHKTPSDTGAPPASDLAWMPPLERTGIDGAGEFDGNLLTKDLVPGSEAGYDRLIGTVLLDSGKLSSTGVIKASEKEAVFEFSPAGNPTKIVFEQAMFDQMVWDASADGEHLELVLTNGDGEERCIQLHPEKGRIELAVHNQELEDILRVGYGIAAAARNTDPDFAASYWMSRAWAALSTGQAVIPYSPALGPGGSGEACKNGRYTGIV